MPELIEANTDRGGSTYYEPITATVEGISQYRDNEFKFVDLDGYWGWAGTPGKLAPGITATVTLKTKPKTGPNARPGSMYRDIVDVQDVDLDNPPDGYETRFTPEGEKVVEPVRAAQQEYDPDNPEATPQQPAAPSKDPTRASIEAQVFYKDFNTDAVAMLPYPEQAAMRAAYFATAMELITGAARSKAVEAYKAAEQVEELPWAEEGGDA